MLPPSGVRALRLSAEGSNEKLRHILLYCEVKYPQFVCLIFVIQYLLMFIWFYWSRNFQFLLSLIPLFCMINLTIVWQPGPLHVLETGEQSGDKTCKIMQYWELDTWQSTSGQTSLSAKNAGSEGESREGGPGSPLELLQPRSSAYLSYLISWRARRARGPGVTVGMWFITRCFRPTSCLSL